MLALKSKSIFDKKGAKRGNARPSINRIEMPLLFVTIPCVKSLLLLFLRLRHLVPYAGVIILVNSNFARLRESEKIP